MSWRPFRRRAAQLSVFDAIELLSAPELRLVPQLGTLKERASDWELVEEGGNNKDGYKYSDPHKCECGLFWDVNTSDKFFNNKPNAQDVANCLAGLAYPNTPSEQCDAPCVAVEQSRHERWRIFKNKKTGQFWLFCSKRVQWHCERVST
jgi:hypothetical protein